MSWLFVAAGAFAGALIFLFAPLFVMGEVSPSLPYEEALPFLLVSCIAGVLVGGYVGRRLDRARRGDE
jgi:hypothetical protein